MSNPANALSIDVDYEGAAVIGAAFESDLFRPLLSGEALSADTIAAMANASASLAEQVLDCLVYLGAAKLNSKRYVLTAVWRRRLESHYDEHRDVALRRLTAMRKWLSLGQAPRQGSTDESLEDVMFRTGAGLARYLQGVLEFNRPMVACLADELSPYVCGVPEMRAADVGGGHAGYLLELLGRHPQLRGDVIDLPATTAVSQRMNANHPLRDRLAYISADARAPLKARSIYGLAMVNDLLHSFSLADKRRIVSNVVEIVQPGGLLAVTKFTHAAGRSGRRNSMFSMKLYVQTNGQGFLESDESLLDIARGFDLSLLRSFRLENKSGFLFRVPA
jgi:O-methyltransferase domain